VHCANRETSVSRQNKKLENTLEQSGFRDLYNCKMAIAATLIAQVVMSRCKLTLRSPRNLRLVIQCLEEDEEDEEDEEGRVRGEGKCRNKPMSSRTQPSVFFAKISFFSFWIPFATR